MKPKLTIMVSIYNSGEWIQNRLENLMRISNLSDTEIWCINANSPDERDDQIPQKFPVKYFKIPERISVYATWNYIIQRTSGQYITNANTDDIVSPNCYEKLISILDNNGAYDFAYPSWYTTDIPNQKWGSLIDIDTSGCPGNFSGDINKSGVGHFPLWRRSIHDKIGLFDEEFKALGDAEFWVRAYHKANSKFCWVNEFLACYLWRNGNNLWHREINDDEWERFHKKAQECASS